jgi:hypothetical protein
MNKSDCKTLPKPHRKHLMKCEKCGQWFDRRELDHVLFHTVDKHMYKPGVRYIGLRQANTPFKLRRPTMTRFVQ